MARFHLRIRQRKDGKFTFNLPASLSPTGKRQRPYFDQHFQALAAKNSLLKHYTEFGLSSVALSPTRRIESAECWDMLDGVHEGKQAPPGSMREIIAKAVKAMRESSKSITLDELWVQYIEKMKRIGRSESHIKNIGYARKAFDFLSHDKLPQISSAHIDSCTKNMPSGARNAHLASLRTAMNFAIRQGYVSKNPVLSLEFAARPKAEIKPLNNDLVEAMLRHAAKYEISLLPYLTIGFYCGIREAELTRILWSDVNLEDAHVMVRAEVNKTRRKRFPPIPSNAMEWFRLCPTHSPSDRIVDPYTPATLRAARRKNFREAGGIGHIPNNAKRITFATNSSRHIKPLINWPSSLGIRIRK